MSSCTLHLSCRIEDALVVMCDLLTITYRVSSDVVMGTVLFRKTLINYQLPPPQLSVSPSLSAYNHPINPSLGTRS